MSARKPKEAPAVWLAPSELVPWVENPRDNALAVKDVARSCAGTAFLRFSREPSRRMCWSCWELSGEK